MSGSKARRRYAPSPYGTGTARAATSIACEARERAGVRAASVKNGILIHQQYRSPPPRPSPAAGFALRGRGNSWAVSVLFHYKWAGGWGYSLTRYAGKPHPNPPPQGEGVYRRVSGMGFSPGVGAVSLGAVCNSFWMRSLRGFSHPLPDPPPLRRGGGFKLQTRPRACSKSWESHFSVCLCMELKTGKAADMPSPSGDWDSSRSKIGLG